MNYRIAQGSKDKERVVGSYPEAMSWRERERETSQSAVDILVYDILVYKCLNPQIPNGPHNMQLSSDI